jgi:hypothetical protein
MRIDPSTLIAVQTARPPQAMQPAQAKPNFEKIDFSKPAEKASAPKPVQPAGPYQRLGAQLDIKI